MTRASQGFLTTLARLAVCDWKLAFRRSGVPMLGIGTVSAAESVAWEPAEFASRGFQFSPQSFFDTSLLLIALGGIFTLQESREARIRFERGRCLHPITATAAAAIGVWASLATTVVGYTGSIALVGALFGNPIQPNFLLRLVSVSVFPALTVAVWSSGMAVIRRSDTRIVVGICGMFILLPLLRNSGLGPLASEGPAPTVFNQAWISAVLGLAGVGCLSLALTPRAWAASGTVRQRSPMTKP